MYFALRTITSIEMECCHEEYLIASTNAETLDRLINDIPKVAPDVQCELDLIESESLTLAHISSGDENYSYTNESGLGDGTEALNAIIEKESKEDSEANAYLAEIRMVDQITEDEHYEILKTICYQDPKKLVEGYDRKMAAKSSGEYYLNPSEYDDYKGLYIVTPCDEKL